jgi:hypothetical protein
MDPEHGLQAAREQEIIEICILGMECLRLQQREDMERKTVENGLFGTFKALRMNGGVGDGGGAMKWGIG